MLNAIIRFSLRHRLLILAAAILLTCYGGWQASQLTIDVFPNLDRPRVVVMVEAHGLAPEEVESLVTFPIEAAMNGAPGVQAVRTQSGVGLSVIYVEFDWGTDIYVDRQIVAERLASMEDQLPPGVTPQLAPISSIMGQIMIVGVWSETGQTSPMELRTLSDWVIRQRLRTIPGVSQVFVMGGDRKQFQVLASPDLLLRYDVTLHEVETALADSNENVTGGYLQQQGPHELLVRALGRVTSAQEIEDIVVAVRDDRPVLLKQVARVVEGPEVKRGDARASVKSDEGQWSGGPAVLLTINKQPGADTREITEAVTKALEDLQPTLPADVRVFPELYQQRAFIDRAIHNVVEALRDGSILVVVILFLFLMNFRTTFITLTAIPLSLVVTALVFKWFGLSINTMTLGGLAVAMGELVDDAIVDVENIFRRLRENRRLGNPRSKLLVVYEASREVRNPIVFGTMIVILVFIPVFALGGMEGSLFAPLGVAYIVSIVSSLLVSLTLTPVLSYWLLGKVGSGRTEKDSFVLASVKWLAGHCIRLSTHHPGTIVATVVAVVSVFALALARLERDFLPQFNEGTVQVNVILTPGTSLETSKQVVLDVERQLQKAEAIKSLTFKTGRAELDEHAVTVNMTEVIAELDPESTQSREDTINEIRELLSDEEIPGIVVGVDQPLAHLMSHTLSGVQAQIAIKVYGDDLTVLQGEAKAIENAISGIPGVKDLQVEPQVEIPQLRIELIGSQLVKYGLTRGQVNELILTAMNGKVVSEVIDGQRKFDLMIRLDEPYRENLDSLRRLRVDLPRGGATTLDSVANIYESYGPSMIRREQVRRRIVVKCNTSGRGLVDVVHDIQRKLKPIEAELPTGYFIEYGGQFQSQKSASQMIMALFALSVLGMFLVLYTMFRSANLALQVMIALPTAFIGAVAALYITQQTLSIAAMVGFISLCGIASRNGIMLISHYLHLVKYEGESWTRDMIIRAGQERVAPVLMTALTSGIGLVPLAMAAGQPGKEILYPVATVIIGGLISSTILEFFVRPALFWRWGLPAARRAVARHADELDAAAAQENGFAENPLT